jgi:ABC-2 type transport system permease protein
MRGWLNTFSHLNPLAYVVDVNGIFMLAGSTSTFGPSYDYAVILLTSTILVFIGARLYPHLAS